VGLISSAKSPVLIELIRLLGDSVYRLDSVDDVDLYEDIVFAVGHQHSTPDFHERRVPEPDDAGALVRADWAAGGSRSAAYRHHRRGTDRGEARGRAVDVVFPARRTQRVGDRRGRCVPQSSAQALRSPRRSAGCP
jgi:hypothetical protein